MRTFVKVQNDDLNNCKNGTQQIDFLSSIFANFLHDAKSILVYQQASNRQTCSSFSFLV